jgi:hypothetical protein
MLRFDVPAERARRLAKPLCDLADWCRGSRAREKGTPLAGTGALRIPEALELVSRQTGGQPCSVLLFGNPLAYSVEEPAFAMVGGRVPSDGHLTTNLAASIYGTGERIGHLRGVSVRLCYLSEGLWSTSLFKERVRRFWSLFTSLQGGEMDEFSDDAAQVFKNATAASLAPVGNYQINPVDHAIEMVEVHPRTVALRDDRPVEHPPRQLPEPVHVETPIGGVVAGQGLACHPASSHLAATAVRPAAPVAEQPPPPAITNLPPIPVAPRGQTGIAAWWLADADVDLYVCFSGAQDLYWHNMTNSFGIYFRDIRTANQTGTEGDWKDRWEYVQLREGVDLANARVYLNLYAVNRTPREPIEGKVRFQLPDGRIQEQTFSFSALTKGNQGVDVLTRDRSPFWIPVDLHASVVQPQVAEGRPSSVRE